MVFACKIKERNCGGKEQSKGEDAGCLYSGDCSATAASRARYSVNKERHMR
jgi:hypothetical protein